MPETLHCRTQARTLISKATLADVETSILRAGLVHFPSSSILHVFAARFYATFLANR
jgi:hypothetical protein